MLVAAMVGIISTPKQAKAADFSAGIYSYYVWWNPAWRSYYQSTENDPMLIWGPVFTMTFFEKLSFSILGLQNKTNMANCSYTYEGSGSAGTYRVDSKTTINRNELDLSVGYKIPSALNVLIGYKFMFCNMGDGSTDVSVSPSPYHMETLDEKAARGSTSGGAAGLSYTIPLPDSFSFTAGTVFLYLKSKIQIVTFREDPGNMIGRDQIEYNYTGYGNNTTLTLTYFIPAISTSFSLGGRFQALKYKADGDAPSLANDYFYGITLAAKYHF